MSDIAVVTIALCAVMLAAGYIGILMERTRNDLKQMGQDLAAVGQRVAALEQSARIASEQIAGLQADVRAATEIAGKARTDVTNMKMRR